MSTKSKPGLAEQRLNDAVEHLLGIVDGIEAKEEFTDAYNMLPPNMTDGRTFRTVVLDSLIDSYIDVTFAMDAENVPIDPYRMLLKERDGKAIPAPKARRLLVADRRDQEKDDYPFEEPECLSIFGDKPCVEMLDVMPAWKNVVLAFADIMKPDTTVRMESRVQRLMKRVSIQFDKKYDLKDGVLEENKKARKGDYTNAELNYLVMVAEDRELPPAAMKHLHSQMKSMDGMQENSSDFKSLMRALEIMVDLPWSKRSKLTSDIRETERCLDENHYGMEDAKQLIAEHVAVLHRTGEPGGKILCLHGAPGIGKTSLAQAIADATGRKLVRVALGGVRDSVAIRGHSSAYIGALPGRIIKGLSEAGVRNPLFLLDEIDKVGSNGSDSKDVEAALLEVIDPQQNAHFRDTYVDVEFNLSEAMFIATANDQWSIMPALRDRMEMVDLPSYTTEQKLRIAQRHLVPKQMETCGLSSHDIEIPDGTLQAVVSRYVRESGVRELERLIEKICRKVAYKLESDSHDSPVTVNPGDLEKYLGKPRIHSDKLVTEDTVGVSHGLGVTGTFGSILPFEVIKMAGKDGFKIRRTGQMKDVMQESIDIVTSWIRANAEQYGVSPDTLEKTELHVDAVNDGAKDGPSAGIALLSACMSVLMDKPLRADLAMTGKMTLGGRVRAIGGTIAKLEGAMREGMQLVLIPEANMKDLSDASAELKDRLTIQPVATAADVLKHVFREEAVQATGLVPVRAEKKAVATDQAPALLRTGQQPHVA